MVKLTSEQKYYIQKTETNAGLIIYYIEHRCKTLKPEMPLIEMIDNAKWLIEEHSFENDRFIDNDE